MLIGEEELRRLLNEVEHLRKQRTELQANNTQEVFRRRTAEEKLNRPPQDALADAVSQLGFKAALSEIVGLLDTFKENLDEGEEKSSAHIFALARNLEKLLKDHWR